MIIAAMHCMRLCELPAVASAYACVLAFDECLSPCLPWRSVLFCSATHDSGSATAHYYSAMQGLDVLDSGRYNGTPLASVAVF